jgi:hypothetical protein
VGPLGGVLGKAAIQKLILMAPQPRIEAVRPEVEVLLAGRAATTTALPGMLEV